jgi:hypothetical protein
MTPIDDELRTALGRRAEALTPAADPLAGIERRARGIRRRRTAGAVLGTTLAVALVAVAVPSLVGSTTTGATDPGRFATSGPTLVQGGVALPPNAVTWPSRPLGEEDLDAAVRTAWAAGTREPEGDVRGQQLFLGATPDGKRMVGVYQLWSVRSFEAVVVVASSVPGGPALLGSHRTTAMPDLAGVVDVVPGDASPWVVALSAPGVAETAYAEDGRTFVPVESDGRGVVFPRTGPTGSQMDLVRFRGDGVSTTVDVGTRGGAEGQDPGASDGEPGGQDPGASDGVPANAVDWPLRGSLASAPDLERARAAWARALGGEPADLQVRPLLALSTDGGLRLLAAQAWLPGGQAHPVHYADGTECGDDVFVGRANPEGAQVLAFSPGCVPGRANDTVWVVPAPTTGQVSYGAEASEWRELSPLPGLEPVVEIERAPRDARGADRLRVLDGDGDLDSPAYQGPLQDLLCGVKECG